MDSNHSETLKKYLLPVILSIAGSVAAYFLFDGGKTITEPLAGRVVFIIMMGWMLGGTAWGWIISRRWFPPMAYFEDRGSIISLQSFLRSMRSVVRIFVSIIAGTFTLPFCTVRFFIALVGAIKGLKKSEG